ncbi:MAG TPA: UDP-N-acetylglucosamine 2-epimerase (non-hydrolyzing) [Bacteroidales bacterium]|nr:UDP-N-acetylglucosamine 2-epimerase (non-hydrolyzing) [Bacteroidales bacterium]
MKIINIVGARPNFIKIAPIIRAMHRSFAIEPLLLHTGQHYDIDMSKRFFEELDIPTPDISLEVGSDTHARQVARIMERFDDVCDSEHPDAILVVGDVNSTMACSLVAAKKGIRIVHVEAGIRSFDRTMPEEINRMVTDAIADLLLPPSRDAVENLLREGHDPAKIHLVGNIMIDTLVATRPKILQSEVLQRFGLAERNYALVTLHRPANVDNIPTFRRILLALASIQEKLPVVFPVHPRTRKVLEAKELQKITRAMPNLILCEPLGYFDFGRLVMGCRMVLTDSGGIQEESTVYGIPCITIRENTERPITLTEGTNELAGSETGKIIAFSEQILDGHWKKGAIPELWDGHTADRIVECLEKMIPSC